MKLNKYIHKQLKEGKLTVDEGIINCPSEETIDDWIADWYNDTFINIRDESNRADHLCGFVALAGMIGERE